MRFNVTLQGKFIDKIASAGREATNFLQQGLTDAAIHLYEKSQQNAPAATGALRQGMRQKTDLNRLQSEIWPSSLYAMFVHGPGGQGRTRPHFIPGKEAMPGGTLYRWAKKKGANPWAVRAAIAKRGTKFQPWLEETADQESDKVLAIIGAAVQNINKFLAD